jgi:hypothetical protein
MSTPLNTSAIIVDSAGRATRALIAYFQSLGTGVVKRTTYTYAEIALMTPTAGDTVVCTDASTTTIGTTLAGGGSDIVQAIGNGTNWKVF